MALVPPKNPAVRSKGKLGLSQDRCSMGLDNAARNDGEHLGLAGLARSVDIGAWSHAIVPTWGRIDVLGRSSAIHRRN